MKVTINKPTRVNLLSGEVEVSEQEYARLLLLGLIENIEKREIPEEKTKRTTRRAK